jgi:hypothetical protein
MKPIILTILVTALVLFTAASVKAARPIDHPGFVDLSFVDDYAGDDVKVEVNISGALLKLAGAVAANEDPDAADAIKNLEQITVRIVERSAGSNSEEFNKWVKDTQDKVRSKGWESIATVREDDENIGVYMLFSDTQISGVFVTVVNKDEAIFVNVVGDIDMDNLSKIGARFDIPGLENAMEDLEK